MNSILDIMNKHGIEYENTNVNVYNFKCPICGDGSSNGFKKRGYLVKKDSEPFYHCHNECGSMSAYEFIKQAFGENEAKTWYKMINYDKFRMEKEAVAKPKKAKTPLNEFDGTKVSYTNKKGVVVYHLKKASTSKMCVNFLKHRRIEHSIDKWYKVVGENAILIPLHNHLNKYIGFQIRWLDEKRFLTKILDNRQSKVYNMHRAVKQITGERVYVFESIIDGMSSGLEDHEWVSSMGSDLVAEAIAVLDDKVLVFALDNDKTGMEKALKYAEKGYHIVVHPKAFKFKDYNEALMAGATMEKIRHYIERHTVGALKAKFKLKVGR